MAKEQPVKKRKGLLTVCVAMGALVVLLVGGWFAWRQLWRVRESRCSTRVHCASRMRDIGCALYCYAEDNGGQFPPGFAQLVPKYVDHPVVLTCCAARDRALPSPDFVYVSGMDPAIPARYILAYEPLARHDDEEGFNVLFSDALPEWWPASREAEFQKRLAEQREAVRRWRAAGGRKEDMEKFFGKVGEKKQK